MSDVNLVVFAECTATMRGVPIDELNLSLRNFAERISMHPDCSEKLTLHVRQYWGSESGVVYSGQCHDFFTDSKEHPLSRRRFVSSTSTVELPNLPDAVKQANALADKSAATNWFLFLLHNPSSVAFEGKLALPPGKWIFVGIDDSAVYNGLDGVLRSKQADTIVLRGLMFAELFHWLADQLVEHIDRPPEINGHPTSLKFESLGEALRTKLTG